MFHSLISTRLPRRPLPRVCPSTIDQPSPFSTCRSSTGRRASVQEHRSGQARSWALNFWGMGCPKWFFLGGVGWVLVACSSGGGGRKKASSLPVVFCLGLLFLPASGLDVDSGDCVYLGAAVVCVYCTSAYLFIYLCPVGFFLTAWSFVYPSFVCTDAARTSSVWVSATVGLLLVGEACAGVSSFFFFFFFFPMPSPR